MKKGFRLGLTSLALIISLLISLNIPAAGLDEKKFTFDGVLDEDVWGTKSRQYTVVTSRADSNCGVNHAFLRVIPDADSGRLFLGFIAVCQNKLTDEKKYGVCVSVDDENYYDLRAQDGDISDDDVFIRSGTSVIDENSFSTEGWFGLKRGMTGAFYYRFYDEEGNVSNVYRLNVGEAVTEPTTETTRKTTTEKTTKEKTARETTVKQTTVKQTTEKAATLKETTQRQRTTIEPVTTRVRAYKTTAADTTAEKTVSVRTVREKTTKVKTTRSPKTSAPTQTGPSAEKAEVSVYEPSTSQIVPSSGQAAEQITQKQRDLRKYFLYGGVVVILVLAFALTAAANMLREKEEKADKNK